MAKMRRRFYVAIYANGLRKIVSLKYRPGIVTDTSEPVSRIVGPFRTFDQACERIAQV